MHASLPLRGRTALITGVSRRRGIGFAIAEALARLGANIAIGHYRPHDLDLPWGGDDLDAVRAELRGALVAGASFVDQSADLANADEVTALFDAACSLTGRVDILVCNQAKSGDDGSILDMTPERLDAFWDVNTRATMLLTAAFARSKHGRTSAQARPGDPILGDGPYAEPQGHVFWLTSGQHTGPMRGEIAYATSKAALAGVTASVAAELLELGIILNTINPGPVNTGYLDPAHTDRSVEGIAETLAAMPFGRFGEPADPARLIAWLCTPEGSWVVGQVLTSDGGFTLR